MGRGRRAAWVAATGALTLLMAWSGSAQATLRHARGPEHVTYVVTGTPRATRARLAKTASILQRRFRSLGARRAVVRVQQRRIVATGAGVAAAANRVSSSGRLELRPVLAILPPLAPGEAVGSSTSILPGRPVHGAAGYQVGPAALTNDDLARARAEFDPGGQGWTVDLGLNRHGKVALNRLAHRLNPRSPPQDAVALVVDGVVQSAPAFQTDSFSGDVSIVGGFDEAQARQLAVALRSGALPVHIRRWSPSH